MDDTPRSDAETGALPPGSAELAGDRDIHRIGGASIENLRLKPQELTLDVPGISVLRCATPGEAAHQMRVAFPKARRLHEAARTVGSSNEAMIRSAGFDIMPAPSRTLPNHFRIIHPDGAAGFSDENLALLAAVFLNSTEH